MSSLEFCYWLQGYFEIRREEVGLSDKQIEIIKDHLQLIFNKVTPNRNVPNYYPSIGSVITPTSLQYCASDNRKLCSVDYNENILSGDDLNWITYSNHCASC